jgi:hypothetical protein
MATVPPPFYPFSAIIPFLTAKSGIHRESDGLSVYFCVPKGGRSQRC